jgi:hypothetical protein
VHLSLGNRVDLRRVNFWTSSHSARKSSRESVEREEDVDVEGQLSAEGGQTVNTGEAGSRGGGTPAS